jgi:hypothetical protein
MLSRRRGARTGRRNGDRAIAARRTCEGRREDQRRVAPVPRSQDRQSPLGLRHRELDARAHQSRDQQGRRQANPRRLPALRTRVCEEARVGGRLRRWFARSCPSAQGSGDSTDPRRHAAVGRPVHQRVSLGIQQRRRDRLASEPAVEPRDGKDSDRRRPGQHYVGVRLRVGGVDLREAGVPHRPGDELCHRRRERGRHADLDRGGGGLRVDREPGQRHGDAR